MKKPVHRGRDRVEQDSVFQPFQPPREDCKRGLRSTDAGTLPALRYDLVDNVLEQAPDRIRTTKQVTAAEEYLADHFPGFPILPGVLMLEALVQAARVMLADTADETLVLGGVKALKYGAMVKPGEALNVEVTLVKGPDASGAYSCKGTGTVSGGSLDGETALSGRFTMRPIRTGTSAGG